MQIHIVSRGETLYGIAARYNIPQKNFFADNGLDRSSKAVIGEALIIAEPSVTHTVSAGETLTSIAGIYGIDILTLYKNNYFLGGDPRLTVGDTLAISYDTAKRRSFLTNGYAYPFISHELLREQMPYMTYMTPFTYGITENGSLVDMNGDAPMIALAEQFGVSPLMHLSTLTESGNFSSDRAGLIFSNPNYQNKIIEEIIANMKQKRYSGLDIDFEFIYPEEKYEYVMFLQNVYSRISPLGYPLFSALAPKISDTQQGTLYEGHDYAAIGASVDKVLLMTYEWGYTYGPPMAVAPINSVEQVIKYGLTRIAADKIIMGIPTYGYDWQLPYERGVTKARSMSPVDCIRLAEKYNAEISFDETAKSPWFKYTDESGSLHEVWFEDVRSIKAKLELAERYKLSGLGYWSLMRKFPQNLVYLNINYDIE